MVRTEKVFGKVRRWLGLSLASLCLFCSIIVCSLDVLLHIMRHVLTCNCKVAYSQNPTMWRQLFFIKTYSYAFYCSIGFLSTLFHCLAAKEMMLIILATHDSFCIFKSPLFLTDISISVHETACISGAHFYHGVVLQIAFCNIHV